MWEIQMWLKDQQFFLLNDGKKRSLQRLQEDGDVIQATMKEDVLATTWKELGDSQDERGKSCISWEKTRKGAAGRFCNLVRESKCSLANLINEKAATSEDSLKERDDVLPQHHRVDFLFMQPPPDQQPYMFVPSFKAVDRELLRISQAQTSSTKK